MVFPYLKFVKLIEIMFKSSHLNSLFNSPAFAIEKTDSVVATPSQNWFRFGCCCIE